MANIQPDRVIRSLSNYSENELSKLMFAIQNELIGREAVPADAIIHSQLPGTAPLKTTEVEMQQQIKQATELGIYPGYYEDWELVQYGQSIADSRDVRHFHWMMQSLFPMFFHILRAEKLASDVVGYVKRTPGNLWKGAAKGKRIFPFDETHSGDFNKVVTEIGILAERLNVPMKEILSRLIALSSGIHQLINGHDDGEALRQAVDEYEGMSETLIQWTKSYKPPGPPKKSQIDRLCAKMSATGLKPKQAYGKVKSDLEADHEDGDTREEWEFMQVWDLDAAVKALSRWRNNHQIKIQT